MSWLESLWHRAGRGVIRQKPGLFIAPGRHDALPTAGVDFEGCIGIQAGILYACNKTGASSWAWEALDRASLDSRYVNTSGDTMTGNLRISSAAPIYYWNESDAAADNRLWRAYADGAVWKLAAINDAESAETFVLTATRSGSTVTGVGINAPLTIGSGGTPIVSIPRTTATLDFGSIAAHTCAELTVTLTGAQVNDIVVLGPPTSPGAGLSWCGKVLSTDTVQVRLCNTTVAAVDPASGTWSVAVIRF